MKREDSHKRTGIPGGYRRPTGHHSRSRQKRKGAMPLAKDGRRGPEETRGLHPSGHEEVLVHNTDELEELEEGQAARIASNVGERKREEILHAAYETTLTVLNGDTERFAQESSEQKEEVEDQ